MAYKPDDENQSTWTPPTPEQIEELRRRQTNLRIEPAVPTRPTRPFGDIGGGRKQPPAYIPANPPQRRTGLQ